MDTATLFVDSAAPPFCSALKEQTFKFRFCDVLKTKAGGSIIVAKKGPQIVFVASVFVVIFSYEDLYDAHFTALQAWFFPNEKLQ